MLDSNEQGKKQSFNLLFSPLRIGRMTLKNRIVALPTQSGLSDNHEVTDPLEQLYASRARGGAGLVVVEPGGVEAFNTGSNVGIHDDRFIEGLARIVETAHMNGASIGMQIMHFGRQWPTGAKNIPKNLVAPSAIPWSRSKPIPNELTIAEIKHTENKFIDVARRMKQAGFDMIELHAAHGYLMSQFFSPLSNTRGDMYGGDMEGRTRFAIEIIRGIREELGHDIVLSCRFNGSDLIQGGLTLEDSKAIAPALVEAGLDMISVSAGVFGSYPTIIPPYDMPDGCYVNYAEGIRRVVNVPVVTAGRIINPFFAEKMLSEGKADLIGLARGLIADPEWPNKTMRGEYDDIRKCIGCNHCLDGVDKKAFMCTINPEAGKGREYKLNPTSKPKEVMVVGGGLAGLEAARTSALRGHRVALYEQGSELGGQWKLASVPPFKQKLSDLIGWYCKQTEKAGVKIVLNKRVTAANIEEKQPDVVIIATGALPLIPSIPGSERPGLLTAWDVLRGRCQIGERALIIGGNSLGLETADFLAESEISVTVVELDKLIGRDLSVTVRWHLLHRLREKDVRIHPLTEVLQIDKNSVVVSIEKVRESWHGFDMIIFAAGTKSVNELLPELKGKVREVYTLGDALEPRKASHAISEGNEIGRMI